MLAAVASLLLNGCSKQPIGTAYDDRYISLTHPADWIAKPSPSGPGVRLGPSRWNLHGPGPVSIIVQPVASGQSVQGLIADGEAAERESALAGSIHETRLSIGGHEYPAREFTVERKGVRFVIRTAQVPGKSAVYAFQVRLSSPEVDKLALDILQSVTMKD